MERHLRALAADLRAAPGDPRAGERVVVAFDAITLRLKELSDRMDDGEDAAAVSDSAALLRCRRLPGHTFVLISCPLPSPLLRHRICVCMPHKTATPLLPTNSPSLALEHAGSLRHMATWWPRWAAALRPLMHC